LFRDLGLTVFHFPYQGVADAEQLSQQRDAILHVVEALEDGKSPGPEDFYVSKTWLGYVPSIKFRDLPPFETPSNYDISNLFAVQLPNAYVVHGWEGCSLRGNAM
jgi:hypothetical protein